MHDRIRSTDTLVCRILEFVHGILDNGRIVWYPRLCTRSLWRCQEMTFAVRFTQRRLDEWVRRWPCSSLVVGTAYFEHTGDLADLSGPLASADVDGQEFDAFVNDHQSNELRKVRGER